MPTTMKLISILQPLPTYINLFDDERPLDLKTRWERKSHARKLPDFRELPGSCWLFWKLPRSCSRSCRRWPGLTQPDMYWALRVFFFKNPVQDLAFRRCTGFFKRNTLKFTIHLWPGRLAQVQEMYRLQFQYISGLFQPGLYWRSLRIQYISSARNLCWRCTGHMLPVTC